MKGKKNFAQTVKQFFNKKLYLYNVWKKNKKQKDIRNNNQQYNTALTVCSVQVYF